MMAQVFCNHQQLTVPYREVGCVCLKNAFLHISNIALNRLAVQISSYPNPNNLYFPQYIP